MIFEAQDSYEIEGRGTVYTGPSPVEFENTPEGKKKLFNERWFVPTVHPFDFRLKGIETFAISTISKGMAIGVLLEPWEKEDE